MKLRRWRRERDITLTDFSRAIGVTPVALNRYERGRMPGKEVMRKIIRLTEGQVTPNDWFDTDLATPSEAA